MTESKYKCGATIKLKTNKDYTYTISSCYWCKADNEWVYKLECKQSIISELSESALDNYCCQYTDKSKNSIDPRVLSELFWSMDSGNQAEFFNYLGYISKGISFAMQMYHVDKSDNLNEYGRLAMLHIGEFGK